MYDDGNFEDSHSRILRNFDRGEFHAFVITLINLSAGAIGIKILRFWGVWDLAHPAIAKAGAGCPFCSQGGDHLSPEAMGAQWVAFGVWVGGWLQGLVWALALCGEAHPGAKAGVVAMAL